MKNVAVIGCGYWGNHIVRNFNSSENWDLKYICDIDAEHLNKIAKSYPNAKAVIDAGIIFADESIDAVAIATPVNTHFDLAKRSLESGKHTWVEKPLTSDAASSQVLVEAAKRKGVILHVDHTFIYTPAVRKIKSIIESGELGEIYYFDSVRINLGLFQHDVNVLWDLAPHDLSILQYLLDRKPVAVSAHGISPYKYNNNDIESIAYLNIRFEQGMMANLHVNWLSPVKIRKIIIGGNRKMLVFDDMEPIEKIKIFDSGIEMKSREDVYESLIQYRIGDMMSPAIKNYEALKEECNHFYDCIVKDVDTDTDGKSGLYVVAILEAADKSMKSGGIPIEIDF
ncbi:MAG: Gfo/Idh/MocA family oxidoreductase [Desulfobulbaceae bacterium]|nr:Gfo/Idh/MocA family oxidoreductase [Desulfobulbaceae bacterium]